MLFNELLSEMLSEPDKEGDHSQDSKSINESEICETVVVAVLNVCVVLWRKYKEEIET